MSNFTEKKNEIIQILNKNISIQEKIDLIRNVKYTDMEVKKCYSCIAKQRAAMKLLEQEKGYEISKLEKQLQGN